MRHIERSEVCNFISHETIMRPLGIAECTVEMPVDSDVLDGKQNISLHTAEPENPASVIIAPVPWSDFGKRPFQMCRIGTMAAYANARVVCLDFPGMGESPVECLNQLSETQVEELKKGRLQELSRLYWQAMTAAGSLFGSDGKPLPISLWGNSLSTLTVAELAASLPEGHAIQDLYLSEPMALRRVNVGLFGARYMLRGGKYLKDYKAMNKGMPAHEDGGISALVGQVVRQPRSHWLATQALARGQQAAVVREAYNSGRLSIDPEHGTRLHVVTASEGLVPTSLVDNFVGTIPKEVHRLLKKDTLLGEGHSYQDSLPAVLFELGRLTVFE